MTYYRETAVNATPYRPRGRVFTADTLPGAIISVAFAKQKARVDFGDDDDLINSYLFAATDAVEKFTNQILVQRQVILRLPSLPRGFRPIELPGGNVISITSVTVDGVALAADQYELIGDWPATLAPTTEWDHADGELLPVVITYQAGHEAGGGDYGANVPEIFKVAAAMAVAEMYEPGMQAAPGQKSVLPLYAEKLLAPHRLHAIAPSDRLNAYDYPYREPDSV